ncbi:hypothetical protein DFH11DRAFT_1539523 [Phellopilus nigrolimitatus]|nr:hypothetical protein DFH11DRAFT_1539523 [Phellopilus nigrolimitatus]
MHRALLLLRLAIFSLLFFPFYGEGNVAVESPRDSNDRGSGNHQQTARFISISTRTYGDRHGHNDRQVHVYNLNVRQDAGATIIAGNWLITVVTEVPSVVSLPSQSFLPLTTVTAVPPKLNAASRPRLLTQDTLCPPSGAGCVDDSRFSLVDATLPRGGGSPPYQMPPGRIMSHDSLLSIGKHSISIMIHFSSPPRVACSIPSAGPVQAQCGDIAVKYINEACCDDNRFEIVHDFLTGDQEEEAQKVRGSRKSESEKGGNMTKRTTPKEHTKGQPPCTVLHYNVALEERKVK